MKDAKFSLLVITFVIMMGLVIWKMMRKNAFKCYCLANYYGKNCEYIDCDSESCQDILILANPHEQTPVQVDVPNETPPVLFNQQSKNKPKYQGSGEQIEMPGTLKLVVTQIKTYLAFTEQLTAFDFGPQTGVYGSCGSILNDQFYLLGGYGKLSHQVRSFIKKQN